jgi:hypothetical protein
MPCPRCAKEFELADVLRGQIINCPDCGQPMRVQPPGQQEESPPFFEDEWGTGIQEELPEEPGPAIGVDPKRLTIKRLRKRKKRRSPGEKYLVEQWNYFTGTFGIFGFVLLGLLGFWLFTLLLTPFLPQVCLGLISFGGLLYTVGWWWIVFIAYQDDGWSGTMCLFTMLYAYVYAYLNLEATWKPAGLMVLGILITISGYATGFYFGAIKF